MDRPAAPFLFKAHVSVGDDEYTAHLNQAQFDPTQPTASVTDLNGKVTNFGGPSSWVLTLAGFQDWTSVNTLAAYLTEHEGDEADVTITDPSGAEHAGTVVCAAVTKGGVVNTPAAFQTTLQAQGAPVTTYPGA